MLPDTTEYTDQELSLMLDRATVAIESARKMSDWYREMFAIEWKRKIETEIFGRGEKR